LYIKNKNKNDLKGMQVYTWLFYNNVANLDPFDLKNISFNKDSVQP